MTSAEAQTLIETWVASVIAGRVDQSWSPLLFASPELAQLVPSASGITVTADATIAEAVEIRIPDADLTRLMAESPGKIASNVAASLSGVRVTS